MQNIKLEKGETFNKYNNNINNNLALKFNVTLNLFLGSRTFLLNFQSILLQLTVNSKKHIVAENGPLQKNKQTFAPYGISSFFPLGKLLSAVFCYFLGKPEN